MEIFSSWARSLAEAAVRMGQRLVNNKLFKHIDRLHYLAVFILLLNAALVVRLFAIQVSGGLFYRALASDQHELWAKLFPKRGEILVIDEDKEQGIAVNKEYKNLFAIPREIDKPGWTAKQLSEILNIDQLELETRLNKSDDPYEPIKNKLIDQEYQAVMDLGLTGIGAAAELGRFYPDGNLFSHVLGFVGLVEDRKVGLYGLEGNWEELLAGRQGFLRAEKDVSGRWIASAERHMEEAEDGASLVLTLDRTIQFFACNRLAETVEKFSAERGSLIIIEPGTGAIITMCNVPNFDPNAYNQVEDSSVYNNSSIFTAYEPGSTFKAITMAAGLDSNAVTPESTYVDEGFVKIGKYTIRNSDGKGHGLTDMVTVLEESLNTGAMHVAEQVGHEIFKKYIFDFGFGEKTGVELDSEVDGNLSALEKSGDIYLATASFGQGITVTPLQMVTAYAAIANGGQLVKPYIVKEIRRANGDTVKTEPKTVRQVISNRAARLLSGMLVSVVKEGHSKKAGVAGYLIAAKTGTAQIASQEVLGYSGETIHSLVGFGPVEDPRFAMIVKIDKPKGVRFAEASAAPLFAEVAKFVLNYWKVKPSY